MRPARLVLALALASSILVCGCDHAPRDTRDPALDAWSATAPAARARVAELRQRHATLAGRIGALRLPPDIDDPSLASELVDLGRQLAQLDGAVAALDQRTTDVLAQVDAALGQRDRRAGRDAVAAGTASLDAALATARSPLAALEARVPAAEAALARHTTTIAAVEQRLRRIAADGGHLDLTAVRFEGARLDTGHVGTTASMDRLLRLGQTCPEIRLRLSAHVPGFAEATGKVLATSRATAVRDHLLAAGVPAERVAVGADPSQAQGPEVVRVVVETPCPGLAGHGHGALGAPAETPGGAPAGTPGGAVDPHAGHDHGPPTRAVPAGVPQPAMPPPPVPTIEPARRVPAGPPPL